MNIRALMKSIGISTFTRNMFYELFRKGRDEKMKLNRLHAMNWTRCLENELTIVATYKQLARYIVTSRSTEMMHSSAGSQLSLTARICITKPWSRPFLSSWVPKMSGLLNAVPT